MEKGVINSIKIEGVKGEEDYKLSDNKWDNKWDLSNSTAAGSYTVSFDGEEGKVEGKRDLTGVAKDDNKVLMMIPQELGDDAKVTIKFTPTGKSAKEASFSLGGTTWVAGSHITYVLSTTKMLNLSMGTITYPDGWNSVNTNANAESQIKSSYANGDAIGMYVVDKYNKVIEANLKFTYNGSQWAVESGTEFKGSPQYNYFVYYPYQSGGLPGAPAKGTEATEENVALAKNFFANAIDTWKSSKLAADQNTLDKMNACDLQIAKASSLDEAGLKISFAMKHTMGLAEITLGAKTFDNNYKLSNYPEYTWKNGTTTFHAYAEISGHSFYKVADYRYVAVVKPRETTGFSCGNTTDADAWTENVLSVKPAANGVDRVTATSKRTSWPDISYTMEVGDIYYSDGAMTHQSEALASGKTPVGIVGYITMNNDGNYWTEKDTKAEGVGGHALVMSLKSLGSTGKTDIGTQYWWISKWNYYSGLQFVNTKELIIGSYKYNYGSGYYVSNFLRNKWGNNAQAAYYALDFPSTNTNKNTGWFLATAGQYYAVLSNLGEPLAEDWPGCWTKTMSNANRGYCSNNTAIIKKINEKMRKVGDLYYTEFMGEQPYIEYTSSEFAIDAAIDIGNGLKYQDNMKPYTFKFYDNLGNRTYGKSVRPFLAF